MPCGGIYQLGTPLRDGAGGPGVNCFLCNTFKKEGKTPSHFCEEWDAYLHRACIIPFLQTPEGAVVLKHEHLVVMDILDLDTYRDLQHFVESHIGPTDCEQVKRIRERFLS